MPISSIAAVLVPRLPGLFKMVEGLLGSKTGEEKMSLSVDLARQMLVKLEALSKISGQPSDEALRAFLEGQFQSLKTIVENPEPAGRLALVRYTAIVDLPEIS